MMKKKLLGWLAVSAAVMVLLPWLAVAFIKGDAGMAAALLLFFIVDPICAIAMGYAAGKNVKEMWSLPVITPILFLFGVWIFFDMGETAFFLYAGVYLALGMAAMLVSALIDRRASR